MKKYLIIPFIFLLLQSCSMFGVAKIYVPDVNSGWKILKEARAYPSFRTKNDFYYYYKCNNYYVVITSPGIGIFGSCGVPIVPFFPIWTPFPFHKNISFQVSTVSRLNPDKIIKFNKDSVVLKNINKNKIIEPQKIKTSIGKAYRLGEFVENEYHYFFKSNSFDKDDTLFHF